MLAAKAVSIPHKHLAAINHACRSLLDAVPLPSRPMLFLLVYALLNALCLSHLLRPAHRPSLLWAMCRPAFALGCTAYMLQPGLSMQESNASSVMLQCRVHHACSVYIYAHVHAEAHLCQHTAMQHASANAFRCHQPGYMAARTLRLR